MIRSFKIFESWEVSDGESYHGGNNGSKNIPSIIIKNNGFIFYRVVKNNDDWYLVWVNPIYTKDTAGTTSFDTYYKCDSIDGLIEFIKWSFSKWNRHMD